jgi:ribonuclease Z
MPGPVIPLCINDPPPHSPTLLNIRISTGDPSSALEAFSKKFDPQVARTVWTPVTEGDEIPIAKDLLIKPLRNGHVPVDQHIIKSLGYMVVQTRKKLRPEFTHLSGEQLRQLAERQGRDSFSLEIRENILACSGDTPVEDGAKWDNTRIPL